MYENNFNYNYDYNENDPQKKAEKKSSSVGRTIAMLLAVAVVGGASGFGGAYLQKTMTPAAEVQAAATETPDTDDKAAVTVAPTATNTETVVSNMLSTTVPASGELSTKQIVKKVTPSVVSIQSKFQQGSSTGTGIILSSDGYIITNAHVVQTDTQEYDANSGMDPYGSFNGGYDDIFRYFFGGGSYKTVTKNADEVVVVLSDDEGTEYEAEIVGADKNSDIAVLKIDTQGKTLQAAEFGDSDKLEMGDTAIAIGYPLGLGLSTSQGIISGLNRTLNVELSSGGDAALTLIQTDTPINAGNSGGPLVNGFGQVIGITSQKLVESSIEGMGFAIPISDAMPIISDLMNQGYVTNRTPQIGITGTDISNAVQRYYSLPVEKGVMVVSVSEGGGAELAGIKAGDVIVAADGQDIESMSDLTEIKSKKKIGDTMTLTLARADGNIDVEITLTGSDGAPETHNEQG